MAQVSGHPFLDSVSQAVPVNKLPFKSEMRLSIAFSSILSSFKAAIRFSTESICALRTVTGALAASTSIFRSLKLFVYFGVIFLALHRVI